ncbi:helix-turn-helix domain-containing protein [Paenibacillus ehimensis]|uniref:helix-turn-helix domain-containing protein n=1 Tax=Paenibacillus ehimensis TaxID=79264 RepID=UPI000471555B|nr:helix-turn-helix transcriptional regulator [Paenibacillus ehimensis]
MGAAIEKNIQRLIEEKGWTIYRLSKNSGVSLTALYSLGGKKQGPNAETLVKLSKALGVSIDELVKDV